MDANARTRFSTNGASRTAMVCTIAIALCASDLLTRNGVGYFQRQRLSLEETKFSDGFSLVEKNSQLDAAISRIKKNPIRMRLLPTLGLCGIGSWAWVTVVNGSFCRFLLLAFPLLC